MMPAVKVGDINIYYEIKGSGDPLLMIMGYGSYSGHWMDITDSLAREYQVILFDNRGTGSTDKPDMPYTVRMMADDAAGLLDAIGIRKTNVFGVSQGGMIAQEFAVSYPDRLINLILGCTWCGLSEGIPSTPEFMAFITDPERFSMTPEKKAETNLPWLWTKEFLEKNPDVGHRYIEMYAAKPTPPHVFISQGNVTMTFDCCDRLSQIMVPTLVIAGAEDRMVPPENSKIIADKIPGAEMAILTNSGHAFYTDQLEESSRVILGFLRRHSKADK
jgi:3-oxoadipate enol-lactonase